MTEVVAIYNVLMSDGTTVQTIIHDPDTTIDKEISKWGNPVQFPVPLGQTAPKNLHVISYTKVL